MSDKMKTAVIYYSFEGNTAYAAEQLAAKTGADLIRIEALKEPPKKGLAKMLVGGRGALFREHPPIREIVEDLSGYERVFLACPVWAGTYPPAVGTFMQNYPMRKKELYFVGVSGGGKCDKMITDLAMKMADNTIGAYLSLVSPLKHKDEAAGKITEYCKENGLLQE